MNPERWSRVQKIFSEAVECPTAERSALLASACGGDEELRREVEEMLAFDAGSEDRLRQAIGGAVTEVVHGEHNRLIGTVIGSYRIKGVLGYGGMGTVYDAERADEHFRQRVAIKLVQQMAVHPQLRARLRAERQILANLDHQFIARLIDGGETSNGTPYLVIEYVDGKSIEQYCNDNKLSVHQRLELFEKVCAAVDYAHRNLVVHRDLKPANILVTADGTPKLLDFGIAKLLNPDPAWATVAAVTRVQDRLLTPEHASPEQVLGRTITTASDVYALGALLYDLLCDRSPYALKNSTPLALERAICNEDPPRPSSLFRNARPGTRPAEDGFDPMAAAALRGVGHQKLARQLSGDIDEIVLKAMRKEPEQRYATAGALAEELRRHRAGEAVVARQGVRRYRVAKFVRRNALSVAMVAVVMVSLIAFASILWVQKKEVSASRDLALKQLHAAREVASFMTDIFGNADPYNTDGKEITAREILDKGAEKLDASQIQTRETRAQMLEAIGYAYHRQDVDDKAIPLLEKALNMRIEAGADELVLATNYFNLAEAQRGDGKEPTKASYNYDEALRLYLKHHGKLHDSVARVLTGQARIAQEKFNQFDRAQALLTEALGIYRSLYGNNHNEVGSTLSDLAILAIWNDELPLAEAYQLEALEIYKRLRAPGHPDHATAMGALGQIYLMRGKLALAEPLINDSIALQAQAFGQRSQRVAEMLETKARLREHQGRYEEAVDLVTQSVALMRELKRASDVMVGYSEDSLGNLKIKLRRYAEAEAHAATALAIYEGSSLPRDHMYFASSHHLLGEALIAQGKASEATESLRTAIAICTTKTGATSWRTARSQSALGVALDMLDQDDEAERLLIHSYRTLASDPKATAEARKLAYERAAAFLRNHGRASEVARLPRLPKI